MTCTDTLPGNMSLLIGFKLMAVIIIPAFSRANIAAEYGIYRGQEYRYDNFGNPGGYFDHSRDTAMIIRGYYRKW
jgi:hypothetical protein